MPDREKVISGLHDIGGFIAGRIGVEQARNFLRTIDDAIELIKELEGYKDIVFSLLDIGYPHNFQKEEPWIRDYCYKITGVIKMAYDAVEEEKK